MKKFILDVLIILLAAVLLVIGSTLCLILYPAGIFDSTYQNALQAKFDTLISIQEPKIIVIGGSSAGFGVNEALLEEATGFPVANLGLHAGFGAVVITELAKANIQAGDIVLLAYEWGWTAPDYFSVIGTDLVMSAFDDRLDMYRFLPPSQYPKIIGYAFSHADNKHHFVPPEGLYARTSFDSRGRMIFDRSETSFRYEGNEHIYGFAPVASQISSESIDYLTGFRDYVISQGAELYFVAPPLYKGATPSPLDEFYALAENEEAEIGIPFISDPADYMFPEKYMLDTIYHCTAEGELVRTRLLAEDLARVHNFS